MIIKILNSRFGAAPATLEKKILRMTDLDDLERLADLALACESLKEFKSAASELTTASRK